MLYKKSCMFFYIRKMEPIFANSQKIGNLTKKTKFLVFSIFIQKAITSAFFKLQRCLTTLWKAKNLYFSQMVDFLTID